MIEKGFATMVTSANAASAVTWRVASTAMIRKAAIARKAG